MQAYIGTGPGHQRSALSYIAIVFVKCGGALVGVQIAVMVDPGTVGDGVNPTAAGDTTAVAVCVGAGDGVDATTVTTLVGVKFEVTWLMLVGVSLGGGKIRSQL